MKLTGDNMIRFADIEYTYKVTFNLVTNVIDSSGNLINTETFTTSSVGIEDHEYPVDNNVLDMFSMDIDENINMDLIKQLLNEYNIRKGWI